MSDPIRCAVSGLRHGKTHCDAYRENPDCTLVAVFDPDPEKAAARLTENPGARAFDNFEGMLDEAKPDLISIASPEFVHANQTIKALEAGCHVLLEKAMARTLDEINAILNAVERTKRLLYVGQEVRLTPAFLDARRLLLEGRLGKVYQAYSCYIHNCEYLHKSQWRGDPELGADPLLGGGCHPIDLLRSLLGKVEEVFTYQTHENREVSPFPDTSSVLLRFESGAMATVEVSIATRRPYQLALRLNGTKGFFDGDNSGADYHVAFAPPLEYAEELVPVKAGEGSHDIAAQITNLVDAIRNGAPLMVDAWEGANSTAVCLAAIESGRINKPVKPHIFERPDDFAAPAEPLDVMRRR